MSSTTVLAPPVAAEPRPPVHQREVEGLRAIASLMVVYCHLLVAKTDLDPHYSPSALWYRLETGHGAVLLFFVLSGYVIGLTNQQQFTPVLARRYLWRRIVRLVPLCWLAVALSVLVRPGESALTVFGNLAFLQNELGYGPLVVPLLSSNTNLWSLNYEALYYLAFVAVWAFPRLLWPAIVVCVSVALGSAVTAAIPATVTNYAVGWLFWIAGLLLARAPQDAAPVRRLPWPSLLLLFVATWKYRALFQTALRFGVADSMTGWLSVTYLDFLPVCAVLVMVAAQRRPAYTSCILAVAAGLPVAYCAWRTVQGRGFVDDLAWADILVALAAATGWWRPSLAVIGKLAWLGGISYGIYILHRPVQWFIHDQSWLPSGTMTSFTLRLVLCLGGTLALAWMGERVIQPWIRQKLHPTR